MSLLRLVPDTPPRAIGIIRVSKEDNRGERLISPSIQRTAIDDLAARNGYDIIDYVTAIDESGSKAKSNWWRRLDQIIERVEAGEAEVIVAWEFSRAARNRVRWAVAIDRIETAGGRLESATEPVDTSTASGRLHRGFLAEIHAYRAEVIGEGWKNVQRNRVARGLPPGGKLPWGWMWENRAVVPHPVNSQAIPQLYELFLAGAGWRTLGRWLEEHGYQTMTGNTEWNHSTLQQLLDTPVHAGYVVHNGEAFPGAHKPLISKETWNRYQAMRRERAESRAVRTRYLLSGLLTCRCGGLMYGFTTAANNRTRGVSPYVGYRCNNVHTPGHGPAAISTRYIDPHVIDWLHNRARQKVIVPTAVVDPRAEVQRLTRELVALEKKIADLTDQKMTGQIGQVAYTATADRYETQHAALSAAVRAAEDRMTLAPEDGHARAVEAITAWETAPLDTKRQFIRDLIESIHVDTTHRRMLIRGRGVPPVAIAL